MTLEEVVFRLGEIERRTPTVLGRPVEGLSVELGSTGSGCLIASLGMAGRGSTGSSVLAAIVDDVEATASVADLAHLGRILRGEERPVWVIHEAE